MFKLSYTLPNFHSIALKVWGLPYKKKNFQRVQRELFLNQTTPIGLATPHVQAFLHPSQLSQHCVESMGLAIQKQTLHHKKKNFQRVQRELFLNQTTPIGLATPHVQAFLHPSQLSQHCVESMGLAIQKQTLHHKKKNFQRVQRELFLNQTTPIGLATPHVQAFLHPSQLSQHCVESMGLAIQKQTLHHKKKNFQRVQRELFLNQTTPIGLATPHVQAFLHPSQLSQHCVESMGLAIQKQTLHHKKKNFQRVQRELFLNQTTPIGLATPHVQAFLHPSQLSQHCVESMGLAIQKEKFSESPTGVIFKPNYTHWASNPSCSSFLTPFPTFTALR